MIAWREDPLRTSHDAGQRDGSPHVTPVGFVQLDGVWYFTSGPGTRKSSNIAADGRCVVRITPATVFAFGTAEPYGATRFDLTR